MNDTSLQIEIVYAEPQRAIVKTLRLAPGSRVADAVRMAMADPDFSAVDLENSALGIFGKPTRPDQPLKNGDRLEIYRPLMTDPKSARRARALTAREASASKPGSPRPR
jgi:uncharacterized protein